MPWTQLNRSATIDELINVEFSTCRKTRDVVNDVRPVRETGRYKEKNSIVHQAQALRILSLWAIDALLAPQYLFDWEKRYAKD